MFKKLLLTLTVIIFIFNIKTIALAFNLSVSPAYYINGETALPFQATLEWDTIMPEPTLDECDDPTTASCSIFDLSNNKIKSGFSLNVSGSNSVSINGPQTFILSCGCKKFCDDCIIPHVRGVPLGMKMVSVFEINPSLTGANMTIQPKSISQGGIATFNLGVNPTALLEAYPGAHLTLSTDYPIPVTQLDINSCQNIDLTAVSSRSSGFRYAPCAARKKINVLTDLNELQIGTYHDPDTAQCACYNYDYYGGDVYKVQIKPDQTTKITLSIGSPSGSYTFHGCFGYKSQDCSFDSQNNSQCIGTMYDCTTGTKLDGNVKATIPLDNCQNITMDNGWVGSWNNSITQQTYDAITQDGNQFIGEGGTGTEYVNGSSTSYVAYIYVSGTTYSCNTSTWQCYEDPNGVYASLTTCQDNCKVGTKYSCNTSTGQCYTDVDGTYTSLSTCQTNCQTSTNPFSYLKYSWSKPGVFHVYVEGKDLNGNTILSNTSTITVLGTCPSGEKIPHNECDSAGRCTSINSCGTDACDSTHPCGVTPPSACSVSLTASPQNILLGRSLNLTWNLNDSCSDCQASCTVSGNDAYPQCGSSWTGDLDSTQGTHSTSVIPTTKGTYVYQITCNGALAEASANVTVQVIPAPWWREIIPNLLPFLRGMIR